MKVRKVEENIAEKFRSNTDASKLFPCDVCRGPGFIEVIGDEECMVCGNTITLCKEHARKLIEDISNSFKN